MNHGGTSSSKNFSILQLFLLLADRKDNLLISVMSETMPHLKMGAIRDFERILRTEDMYDDRNINKTDHQYFFGSSVVEFFSADTPGKVTGPRRDILYVNEAINIPYALVEQAEIRTDKCIFYDYNPHHDFWITEKVFMLPEKERTIIRSNYLDNSQLSESIKHEIEMKAARDVNFKRIHIDLEFGRAEGIIFPDFNLVDEMPAAAERQAYGMDFGFTNDPTTLIDERIFAGEIWLDELLYRTEMTSGDIISFLKLQPIGRKEIIADSEDPRTIEEIRRADFNIKPAVKGPDSVIHGIDSLKRYRINVTKRSVNLIKELRQYRWKIDKSGKPENKPVQLNDHAIDASRYAAAVLIAPKMTAPRATY